MLNPLASTLEETRAALALAERTIQELRDFVTDLLLRVGSRVTCPRCGASIFWVITRGDVDVAFNPDGSQHWPRCKGAARPREAAAGE